MIIVKLYAIILTLLIISDLIYRFDSSGKVSHLIGFRTPSAKTSTANWRLAQRIGYGFSIPIFAVILVINIFVNVPMLLNVVILIVYVAFIITLIEQKSS